MMHRNTCISSGALRLASLSVKGATSSIDMEGKSEMDLTSGSVLSGRNWMEERQREKSKQSFLQLLE